MARMQAADVLLRWQSHLLRALCSRAHSTHSIVCQCTFMSAAACERTRVFRLLRVPFAAFLHSKHRAK
jgi:hypothetical protein